MFEVEQIYRYNKWNATFMHLIITAKTFMHIKEHVSLYNGIKVYALKSVCHYQHIRMIYLTNSLSCHDMEILVSQVPLSTLLSIQDDINPLQKYMKKEMIHRLLISANM